MLSLSYFWSNKRISNWILLKCLACENFSFFRIMDNEWLDCILIDALNIQVDISFSVAFKMHLLEANQCMYGLWIEFMPWLHKIMKVKREEKKAHTNVNEWTTMNHEDRITFNCTLWWLDLLFMLGYFCEKHS